MATKRLPPPLVGGIQQASVVEEEDPDEEPEDDRVEQTPIDLGTVEGMRVFYERLLEKRRGATG